jgi:NADH-quinone oxidoreductase subunit J
MNYKHWLFSIVALAALVAFGDVAWAQEAAAAKPDPGNLGNSKTVAVLFWLTALGTVGGSVFVLFVARSMIAAAMGMVATFFAVATIYAMLYAHFLAVIQILVYAGAIMVLFVFVVMILNKAEEEPWATQGLVGKVLGFAGLGYFLYRLASALWMVKDSAVGKIAAPDLGPTADGFGTTRAMGQVLFTKYLFPFEAVSIVLLVAVVGAIAVARPSVQAYAQKKEASAS